MRRTKTKPPGPKNLKLLSASIKLMLDPLGCFDQVHPSSGDFVRLKMGMKDAFLVSDPLLIERIFVSDNRNYIKDIFTQIFAAVWEREFSAAKMRNGKSNVF